MMNTPLVSIIVSFYNAESFLKACVQSVLNQDYQNWELLLIDDGSKDRSFSVAQSFEDKRLRCFQKENGGVSSGRNLGMKEMKGDFFCFLDADDIFPAGSISSRMDVFRSNPKCDFVDGVVVKKNSKMDETIKVWAPTFNGNPLEDLIGLTGKCFFGPSWMIRRNPHQLYQFHEGLTHCEDLLFYIELAQFGGEYLFTNEEILNYRLHSGSAMANIDRLVSGYHYVYDQLRKMNLPNLKILEAYRKRASRIITRCYIREFSFIKALTRRLSK